MRSLLAICLIPLSACVAAGVAAIQVAGTAYSAREASELSQSAQDEEARGQREENEGQWGANGSPNNTAANNLVRRQAEADKRDAEEQTAATPAEQPAPVAKKKKPKR